MSGRNIALVFTIDDGGSVLTPIVERQKAHLRIPAYVAKGDDGDAVQAIRSWINRKNKKASGRFPRSQAKDCGAFGSLKSSLGHEPTRLLSYARFGGEGPECKSGEAWHLHVSREAFDDLLAPHLPLCRLVDEAGVSLPQSFGCENERMAVLGALRNAQPPATVPLAKSA